MQMQQSTALKHYDEEPKLEELKRGEPANAREPTIAELEKARIKGKIHPGAEDEPAKLKERIVSISISPELADDYAMKRPARVEYSFKNNGKSLVPCIFAEILRNLDVYALIVVMTLLAMFKIYQVHETRSMTAAVNEVSIGNANLQKEWLSLLAQRQSLSEHSLIREQAAQKLEMFQPKTEEEIVIRLP